MQKLMKCLPLKPNDCCLVPVNNLPPTFSLVTNLYEIKKSFMNNNYKLFIKLVKQHNFKLFSANYKYSHEKNGVPNFIAKNLIERFVRNFDGLIQKLKI